MAMYEFQDGLIEFNRFLDINEMAAFIKNLQFGSRDGVPQLMRIIRRSDGHRLLQRPPAPDM